MRIVFLLFSGSIFGGAERRYARLAERMSACKEHDITVVCTADAKKTINQLGIDVERIKVIAVDRSSTAVRFKKVNRLLGVIRSLVWVTKLRADHVHLCANPGLITVIYASLSIFLPKFSMAMVDSTYSKNLNWIKSVFCRFSHRKCCSVDCLSSGTKEIIEQVIGFKSEKCKVAPCSFSDYSKVSIARERDIDVLLMSRLVEYKGHDLLAEAMPDLADLNVHICGAGSLDIDFRTAKVYKTNEPYVVMGRAKISLSIQKFENYPSQVALESMASGCAVIATDVGDTRRFLDESDAILIEPRSDQLVSAIRSLLEDEKLRTKLGHQARARVLKDHTVEKYERYFVEDVVGF